jgi:hypothetical protein
MDHLKPAISVRLPGLGPKPMYSWQNDYLATLAETDPIKLRRRIYEAVAAIEQRRLSPVHSGSEESHAIERAERAIQILKKSLPKS